MNNNLYLKQVLIAIAVVLCVSCESGFNEIGTEIVGGEDFVFESKPFSVVAYSQNLLNSPTLGVQSNNLPINALGILNNPVFGTTTSNFVTQLELASTNINPTINLALQPVIDSVVMTIPYFKTADGYESDGTTIKYVLDSIYGPSDSKLNLKVYESKYYLRTLDPATGEAQEYFSSQNAVFESNKGSMLNTGISPKDPTVTYPNQNTEFNFSNKPYFETVTSKEDVKTTTQMPPAMHLYLDKAFFTQKFFTTDGTGMFVSNDVFKNYFRGLYFNVSPSSASATTNQALIDFKKGKIVIYYKQYEKLPVEGEDEPDRINKTLVLNLTGTTVNLFETPAAGYNYGTVAPNPTSGDANLYLKGGAGSMSIIKLFGDDADGNGVADELDELRAANLLINDATITFFIDQDKMAGADEPNRIYLYDLNNNKPLTDYTLDLTTRSATKYNKYKHGGIIQKNTATEARGTKYSFKITNHVINMIKNDTVTNVRLGLVVTENINVVTNKSLESPVDSGQIKKTPESSVINPLGTILYGNTSEVPNDKKIKFEIYYTKPKQ